MSILSINVPVPVSGDGASVNIENIVGEKTVQLSGLFEGYYDLLASHDDVVYVPVTAFGVSGTGEIKQTIAGAFKFVRLRSGAQAISAVVCEISGVQGTGENGFGTIASIGAGFSGLTPIIDTATFISPSGSEDDTNFICRGDFSGAIVVLGSIDGVEFNPLGEFRVDRRPEGAPAVLELSPLVTQATLRYVRLQVPGTIKGAVVVTMGGRVPATGGGGGGTIMPLIVSDRSAVNHIALGNVVALGYQAGSVLAGDPLTVSTTDTAAVVVIGANLTLAAHSPESSLIGSHSSSIGPFAAMLGPYQVNSGANSVAMVGTGNKIGLDSHNGVTVGTGNEIKASSSDCFIIGDGNTTTGPKIVAIGTDILVIPADLTTTPQQVAIGFGMNLTGTMPGSVTIGNGLAVTTDWSGGTNNTDHACVVIGSLGGIAAGATVTASVLLGVPMLTSDAIDYGVVISIGFNNIATTDDANDRIEVVGTLNTLAGKFLTCFGHGNNVGASLGSSSTCLDTVVVGENCAINDGCSDVVAIGNGAVLGTIGQRYIVNIGRTNSITGAAPNGSTTEKIVVVGAFNTVGGDTSPHLITLLGSDNTLGEGAVRVVALGSAHTLGATLDAVVAIGNEAQIGLEVTNTATMGNHVTISNTCTEVVAIGYSVSLTTSEQSKIVNIGSTNVVQGNVPDEGVSTEKIVVVGALNTVGGTDTNSSKLTVLGSDNTLGEGSIRVVALGSTHALGITLDTAVVIGNECQVGQTVSNTVAAGSHVTISNTCTEVVMLGYSVALTTTEQSKIVNIGSTNIVQGSTPDEAVRTEKIVVVGSLNTVGNTTANSSNLTVLGSGNNVGQGTEMLVVIGNDIVVPDNCLRSIVMGDSSSLATGVQHSLCILGQTGNAFPLVGFASSINLLGTIGGGNATGTINMLATVGSGSYSAVVVGFDTTIGVDCAGVAVVGGSHVVGDNNVGGVLVGNNCIVDADIVGTVGIGSGVHLTGNAGIGIGNCDLTTPLVVAANQCVIGQRGGAETHVSMAINDFLVDGWNDTLAAGLYTIRAINNPGDGETGLTLVYNAAGTYSNKTVKAAVTPAPGSLLLYVDA